MFDVILIRNSETKKVFYKHELTVGEKPWEILQTLSKMSFPELPMNKREYVMDPDRETEKK